MTRLVVHPANLFVTTQEQVNSAVGQIDVDLGQRVQELEDEGRASKPSASMSVRPMIWR